MSQTPAFKPVTIGTDVLERAAEVITCLGRPVRLRLVEDLESGERTVSEGQAYAGIGLCDLEA